jgi:hypothetical protein
MHCLPNLHHHTTKAQTHNRNQKPKHEETTHLQVSTRLLDLITSDSTDNRILLSLDPVGGTLDVSLGLGRLDLCLSGCVSLRGVDIRIRRKGDKSGEEAYLLSVSGELRRLSAAADGLVGCLDSRTNKLFN